MGEIKDPQKQNQSEGKTEEAWRREEEIQKFRQEIASLRRVEAARGWRQDIDLKDVNPDELTDEDAFIYYSARNGTITRESFRQYEEKFVDSEREPREGVSQSTAHFIRFMSNRINLFLLRKGREEQERERKRKDI